MAFMLDLGTGVNIVNVLLLLGILFIYLRGFKRVRSGFVVGLILFAVLLLAQNIAAVYFQTQMIGYYTEQVAFFGLVLSVIETIALIILLWLASR